MPDDEIFPSEEDFLYEEEVLRNPNSFWLWWRYLVARRNSPFKKRAIIYERALKALPGSYKLWNAYLHERLEVVRNLPITHSQYQTLNNTFERALASMIRMPRIWIMYLKSLTHQKLVTKMRRTFDRALCTLPVTQHDRIWELYLPFVSQKGIPIETSLRVYRRYLKYDPSHIEDFIEFLVDSARWQAAGERLSGVLNDEGFYSIKGKTKHRLWLELCELAAKHANNMSGLNVDAIIRGGIRKFSNEVGCLWTSLADYYIRRGLFEKARDVFEEGIATVVTVRDFGVIFDAYSQFEESMLSVKMESFDEEADDDDDDDEGEEDNRLYIEKLEKGINSFWLKDDKDIDLRLARLDHLMDRRPALANSVLLRQNPHNVEQWHRRVELFEGNPVKQILTYTEAVRTVDPMKAVGKPHTLWVAFAKLYEAHNDVSNARAIFDKAVQVNFKTVDHLATVWCEWAEMEIKHNNVKGALELMRRATAELSVEVRRKVAADGNEPVQMKIHKSLKLWTLHVDLEESLGTLDSTRAVYEKILDLKIATPQIIINYAMLLLEDIQYEDAFKVYERGVNIFKYPHVKDIWATYLSKFVERYGHSKQERVRDLYERAIEMTPSDSVKPLYLQYAQLEEEYGFAERAMMVYDRATKAVPLNERLGMYEIYIARAAKIFGVSRAREIYEQAIKSGLPDKDLKTMCLKHAELEKSLGEIDRSRTLYKYASQFADPITDPSFWSKWLEFEVQHGSKDTFREMRRVERSVSASFIQTRFILHLMPKDEIQTLEEANDEMGTLEQQLVLDEATNDTPRRIGFVNSAQVEGNGEDIELPDEESDSEVDDEVVEIAQSSVPSAVIGGLVREREEESDDNEADGRLGALERIKRMRRGG